ncbi:MAG TPA: alcohol dehydrogenase catalytic domain-containing protein [Planctomycetota bacterium]|nr:alcohol dehydrogenase catalytic domain-containing protein [Planctomycetota bacterium]
MELPSDMDALVAGSAGRAGEALANLALARVPRPRLAPGRVLVRIHAAPVNPADLLWLEGRYGIDRAFPATPGFEGAGVVVASGGGLLGRWLVGKRVACGGHTCSGTWAEFCLADADQCMPLRRDLAFEQGATAMANPMTAIALVDLVRRGGHRAYVQNAAAGQLGRMIDATAREAGIPGIHVVRRAEQAEALRQAGAGNVLVSSDPGFETALATRARELSATIALDAVAGASTGRLLGALPRGGEVVVYGSLSGEPCGSIDPMALAFGAKRVRGFELVAHLRELGLVRAFLLGRAAQARVASGRVETRIRSSVPLTAALARLPEYVASMTEGKLILVPSDGPGSRAP